jgi:hypothetical protein
MTFFKKRKRVDRLADARTWLTNDERGRVVGLFIVAVVMSVALSLLATVIVGAITRRCGNRAAPDAEAAADPAIAEAGTGAEGAESTAGAEGAEADAAGVPVMADATSGAGEHVTT